MLGVFMEKREGENLLHYHRRLGRLEGLGCHGKHFLFQDGLYVFRPQHIQVLNVYV